MAAKLLKENFRFKKAAGPKVWTSSSRQDPIYEDIDIENHCQKRRRDSNQKRNSQNIIYGFITAKEVAKFRPGPETGVKSEYY